MTVLVLGGAGFLGSRLVGRLAANGNDVVAVTRRAVPVALRSNPNVHWVVQDIADDGFDMAGLMNIEAVVHLAGATLGSSKDEYLFLRANEQTTVRLFQALADRTDRFIFASSQVVYGDARHLKVTEDFPLKSDSSAYACSKVNSENWLRWFQKRHGGQYLALRFCGFIEGGGIVDYIIDRALTGEPIELYSQGTVRRDYLPVAEAIDVLISALDLPVSPRYLPINIGSGQAVSAHELAILICAELQSLSRIELCTAPSPRGDFVFCIDRASQLFGFRPGNLTDAVRSYAQQRQKEMQRGAGNEKN